MKRRIWTDAEKAALRRDYPNTPTKTLAARYGCSATAVYGMADVLGLHKSEDYLSSRASGRCRKGGAVGAAHRFMPGHKPHNTGVKGWDAGGNSSKTRFKPGHRGGRAAERYQPVGAERVTKDGYLQRKVNDDWPLHLRWKAAHQLVWEEHNGPIPKGHIVVFSNGNNRDTRIDNLRLISRAENMRRNSIQRFPKELKSIIRLAGKLRRKIDEKQN